MKTLKTLKAELLADPCTRDAYDAQAEEFALARELIAARTQAGLTQADVAERMGTKAPAVARLENALVTGAPSPSLNTLRKYAAALGKRLEVRLVG